MRQTVVLNSGCLDELSTAQRRVLALRAGLGAGPARSRAGAARRLRISERRVARLERTGLRRLRSLARAGACTQPTPAETAVTTTLVADVAPAAGNVAPAPSTPAKTREPSKERREPARGGVEASMPSHGGVAGESVTNLPAGVNVFLPLLLAVLAAIVVGVRQVRREPHATTPAPEPTQPAEPTWMDPPRSADYWR